MPKNYSINASFTHLIFDNNFGTKRVHNASLAKSGSFECHKNAKCQCPVINMC